ncbi:MAG TPA: helix-turn-helix domain-containing protein [Microbacteriaceae bacterium]|nr:helix-turn-helix domain-containing protein [Microbacteriaceae bacterium]
MAATVSLVERKRRRARERIVQAADELFSAHGYDKVSVSDIAERAEVGRTTFFRYFGDKPEVVFAKQQELLDAIAAARDRDAGAGPRTTVEAIEQLRPIVLDLCSEVTSNPDGYRHHFALLADHAELRGRDALKTQQVADALNELLLHRGCEPATARLSAELSLACLQTPIKLANDPETLRADVNATFDRALALGRP